MRFELATATRIVFGPGAARELAGLTVGLGRRALVLTGASADRAAPLAELLRAHGVETTPWRVDGEPTIADALAATQQARAAACDWVCAIGGGSVIDTGKAVAALLANGGEPLDYLEVIGRGRPLELPSAPCVAIPTTAGAGAEVTRNAVLGSPEHRVKVSMRSPTMLPRLALVDPELTYAMPPAVTASTGLDAMTQLIEAFVSNAANPLTDGICREGLRRAARSVRRACENGADAAARADMALAALFGGLALANAKLGAVHGFAGVLGGMFAAPHGAICARLLPYVMEANVRALQSPSASAPAPRADASALDRYDEVARIVTARDSARAADGAAWARELSDALSIPSLSAFGLRKEHFPAVVEKAQQASSMKGNPIQLTAGQLGGILAEAAS